MKEYKQDFPLLQKKKIVYLDSAATTQKPQDVIDAEMRFYTEMNANVHRGMYELSEQATESFEHARSEISLFINAKPEEIIFTKGTTESLNLLAYSLGKTLKKGDELVVSIAEHHSNFVPWQQLAKEKGCKLNVVGITQSGELDMQDFEKKLNSKTKIVALTYVSNVLGTVNDIKAIAEIVHRHKALLVVDAAQGIAHKKINVRESDADFVAFSGHKMYGPTGIGVLYGKQNLLESLPPFLFGGDMIRSVEIEKSTWNELPWKFEAGTPNIAGAIGLGSAVAYLKKIGMDAVEKQEQEIMAYALAKLKQVNGITIYGPSKASKRCAVISFTIEGMHPHDIVTLLDRERVAVRGGHHCAMPLMNFLDIPGSVRISFGVYTTKQDIDECIKAIEKAKQVFGLHA